MAITRPELPYAQDALEPHISRETLQYHYGKHHQGYVDKLNAAIEGTEQDDHSLEEIILNSDGGIFNNAAQVWNHAFYWNSLSPDGGGEPTGAAAELIAQHFGSFDAFRDQFNEQATTLFGSGWTWLIQEPGGGLAIGRTSNAGTPLTGKNTPLLTCDMWEHAYYIDYRNAKAAYMEAFWNLVNWDFVNGNLK